MIIGQKLDYPIESYSNKLIELFSMYMDNIKYQSNIISTKANEKAKIYLRAAIFQNKGYVNDFKSIENDCGIKTQYLINQYSTCIMQLVGRLAECMIIDKCINDIQKNIIFMNIALYMKDKYAEYSEINYRDFVPFSPSFKFIYIEENGVIRKYNVPEHNPNHTSKDIGWCRRDNIIEQLKVPIPQLQYIDNAKIQVKVSRDYANINVKQDYYLTPIVYFDLMNDGEALKRQNPNSYIILGREIDENMHVDLSKYFKIIAAYITGIIDHLNIEEFEVRENDSLAYLLRSDINNIFNPAQQDIVERIRSEVEKFRKPIIIAS